MTLNWARSFLYSLYFIASGATAGAAGAATGTAGAAGAAGATAGAAGAAGAATGTAGATAGAAGATAGAAGATAGAAGAATGTAGAAGAAGTNPINGINRYRTPGPNVGILKGQPKGEAMPNLNPTAAIQFRNCRHGFGEPLSFDVVVNGSYPDRQVCIVLTQPGETYKGVKLRGPVAYLNIPRASVDDARSVVDALGAYQLSCAFRAGEPISVSLCWEKAPNIDWQISY